MKLSTGNSIPVIAPAGGLLADVPVTYGALVVVPIMDAAEGETVTANYRGYFDGPIKDGVSPVEGEHVYLDGAVFTNAKKGAPLGIFIDNGVLLTGALLADA